MTLQASALRSSLTFKVLFIAFLVLVLLIPMNMVENIIRERGHLYRHANEKVKDAVIFQASVPVNKSGVNEFEIEYEVAGSSEFNLKALPSSPVVLVYFVSWQC